MKKVVGGGLFTGGHIIALLFILIPLAKGNAQGIKVSDSNSRPVSSAIVAVMDINSKKQEVLFTDNSGFAQIKSYSNPVQLLVKCLGYNDYTDTLNDFSTTHSIRLTKSIVNLNEIVVTGEYAPKSITESLNDFVIISKEKMEQQAAVSVKDVFQQQLNMRIERDPALQGSGLSLRGMSGNSVKFLVDGVPVVGRMNGFIDLDQLTSANVEKIEIVNGPMSVNYGTDAIGGVVNIITSKMGAEKITAGAGTYYESTGQYNVDGTIGYRYKASSLRINGGRNFFGGWSAVDTARYQTWKPKEQYFGDAKFTYDFKKLKLLYHLSAFNEKITVKGNPVVTPYTAYAIDDYYKTFRLINQLNADYLLSGKSGLTVSASRSDYRRVKSRYRKDMVELEQSLTNKNDQDTTYFTTYNVRSAFSQYAINDKLNFQAGLDFNFDGGKGGRIETGSKFIGDYAAFASAEYSFNTHLEIRPGVRYAYNTLFDAPLIPSLNVKYSFSNNHQIRASYSRGFRAPTLKELYLDFVDVNHDVHGNPELQAENSSNFSLSYTYTLKKENWSFKIQPLAFYNDINNQITLAQIYADSLRYSYINVGKYRTVGGQLSNDFNWQNLNVNAGVCYTGRYNNLSEEFNTPAFTYSPEVSASAGYLFVKTKTTVSVFAKYNGQMPGYYVDGDVVKEFTNGSYTMIDAGVQQKLFNGSLIVGAGVKNITNVEFIKIAAETSVHGSSDGNMAIGTGRSGYFKIQYTFGK